LAKLTRVKAIVVYGEKALPSNVQDKRFFLWRDFLNLGKDVPDKVIEEKIAKQKPGMCCCLIYTSGTTGNPKGCMLSHDNLTWEATAIMETFIIDQTDLAGPHNRVVSYLPLSHIAGLEFDLLSHYYNGSELYFAKPDALQGSLV
jgi:long-chain-fatty-acid--CoA ligase ACSBG